MSRTWSFFIPNWRSGRVRILRESNGKCFCSSSATRFFVDLSGCLDMVRGLLSVWLSFLEHMRFDSVGDSVWRADTLETSGGAGARRQSESGYHASRKPTRARDHKTGRHGMMLISKRQTVTYLVLASLAMFGRPALGQAPWQNPDDALDVSGDAFRGVDDFHQAYSELFVPQIVGDDGELPKPATPPPFLDVSGDGYFAPNDMIQLINAGETFAAGIPDADTTVAGPVSVRFDFRDLTGAPISQVDVGESFVAAMTIMDDRPEPFGIFGS
jgi:hypothetical protein